MTPSENVHQLAELTRPLEPRRVRWVPWLLLAGALCLLLAVLLARPVGLALAVLLSVGLVSALLARTVTETWPHPDLAEHITFCDVPTDRNLAAWQTNPPPEEQHG